MIFTLSIPALATNGSAQVFLDEYYTSDGNYVEMASFEENGEYAAVVKGTFPAGQFM